MGFYNLVCIFMFLFKPATIFFAKNDSIRLNTNIMIRLVIIEMPHEKRKISLLVFLGSTLFWKIFDASALK